MKQTDLLSVEEARDRILARFMRLESQRVLLEEAGGRILAEPVSAPLSLPPFANSSMDGFAVQHAATIRASREYPVELRVVSSIAAGSWSDITVTADTCARIMTGAPLPPGADAVIPFEEVEERQGMIWVSAPTQAGACIRPAGNDVRRGTPVLEAGTELGTRQIGLLAALGQPDVSVVRRPRVAVLSTGDELVQPGVELQRGQIYNSNSVMLRMAIEEAGAEALLIETARDDRASISLAMRGARGADLLITSGGASVGDFDHVKDVVGGEGDLTFWRVRIRPGKPLLFGSLGSLPIIGLPGNPTSAIVTFEEFVRPAIRTMLGASPRRPEIDAVLDERVDNHGGRRTYVRVRLTYRDGHFHAHPSGPQDSAMLVPLAHADGLLIAPEDRSVLDRGETARVQVWTLPNTT